MKRFYIIFLLIQLAGCKEYINLESPIGTVDTSEPVQIYAYESYKYFQNLGFSHGSSKLLSIRYMLMFLGSNPLTNKDAKNVKREYEPTIQDAKNVFACTILSGNTKLVYERKEEIEKYVIFYIDVTNYRENILTERRAQMVEAQVPNNTKEEESKFNSELKKYVDGKVSEKYGLQTKDRLLAKLAELIDYHNLFEACGIYNEVRSYMNDEGAQYID